ncbi:hypothetical protein [Haloplanus salinus]|jgi:hypothetical protein|nr:hypothetical protein [Haloplanus salinus]
MSGTSPSKEQSNDRYYLPGTSISATTGPVERLLTRLFRRRGRF